METCSVCDRPILARGYCGRHYKQMYMHGEIRLSQQEWLKERLSRPFTDDCVEWPFKNKDSKGYGFVRWNGAVRPVAHLSLKSSGASRPEPPDHCALHSCDNPACFNPNHLAWGSNAENARQRESRGRRTPAQGSRINTSRLTDLDIPVIFTLDSLGFKRSDIAKMFEINWGTVDQVLKRRTWKHLEISSPLTGTEMHGSGN